MVYGYARVSTQGQARDGNSLQAQDRELRDHGASEVFSDAYTGTKTDRPQLTALLSVLKSGDTVIVTKLDRIARNLEEGIHLIDRLNEEGIKIHILNMGIIDNSSTGRLIRNIMLSFAEYERDLIITRMNEGKAIARQREGYREGRPRKYTHVQLNHAMEMLESKSYSMVSAETGISKSTLQREKRRRKETTV